MWHQRKTDDTKNLDDEKKLHPLKFLKKVSQYSNYYSYVNAILPLQEFLENLLALEEYNSAVAFF